MQTLYPESGLRTAPNWPKIWKFTMTSQFSDMTSTSFLFDVVLFLLSSLVTGPSFMWISSPVPELWQFSFIRDWPEIWTSEIPASEFWAISGDWCKLWVLNVARMSLIECYWELENSRVKAFTIFKLFRENQLPQPRLGLNSDKQLWNYYSPYYSTRHWKIAKYALSFLFRFVMIYVVFS